MDLEKLIVKDDIELPLHKVYMDDINLVVDIVADKNDRLDILEKTTANRLQLFANSIFPNMFKVKVDYPSNNPDNRMPLLYLKSG